MTATVNAIVSEKKNVLVVPTSAISVSNNQNYVTLGDGTRAVIEVGMSDDTNTEVVS
jgi:small-conductance mechanosensitive channel